MVIRGGACFEFAELRVAINLPPFTRWQMRGRRGGTPGDAFEMRGGLGGWTLIIWPDLGERAGGEEEWKEKAHGGSGK